MGLKFEGINTSKTFLEGSPLSALNHPIPPHCVEKRWRGLRARTRGGGGVAAIGAAGVSH